MRAGKRECPSRERREQPVPEWRAQLEQPELVRGPGSPLPQEPPGRELRGLQEPEPVREWRRERVPGCSGPCLLALA